MTFYAAGFTHQGCDAERGAASVETVSRDDAPTEFYAFRVVPARKLLHIKISGFWTAETIASFTREMHMAIGSLSCAPGEHLICCDVSLAAIQQQDIVAAFQDLIVNGKTRARKMALFTTRVLPRMQSRRVVAVRDNIAFFETEATALRWLISDTDTTS